MTPRCEAFTHDQLRDRLERNAPTPRNDFINRLYTAEERKATSTWPNVKDAYKTWVKLSLGSYGRWTEFLAVVEARNAVVHGLGQFTKQQLTDANSLKETIKRLEKLGYAVDASNNRLVTTPISLLHTTRVLREFLEYLDAGLGAIP